MLESSLLCWEAAGTYESASQKDRHLEENANSANMPEKMLQLRGQRKGTSIHDATSKGGKCVPGTTLTAETAKTQSDNYSNMIYGIGGMKGG